MRMVICLQDPTIFYTCESVTSPTQCAWLERCYAALKYPLPGQYTRTQRFSDQIKISDLKIHKSPGTDRIPAKLLQAGGIYVLLTGT